LFKVITKENAVKRLKEYQIDWVLVSKLIFIASFLFRSEERRDSFRKLRFKVIIK